MKIDFANLQLQYQTYKDDIDKKIQSILKKSNYILGEEVGELEENLQKFTGVKHAITCSSGTDALLLALITLNIKPGDEIITTPFTWISTAETIALINAKPVFVDIEPDTFNIDSNLIEKSITKKTKAIMPVSLFGQPPDIDHIQKIARQYNLKIILDGAQSFGSTYKRKKDSTYGDISITSFFPSKPFGCYGDGGAVFTNNLKYAEKLRSLRVHGQNKRNNHKYIGMGARMDTLQAAVLLAKFPYFSKELINRQKIAEYYTNNLSNILKVPVVKKNRTSSWAQYTIRVKNRKFFQTKLKEKKIPTSIFYSKPLHLQKCFEYLNYNKKKFLVSEKASTEVISLPINAFLNKEQINYIIKKIKEIL